MTQATFKDRYEFVPNPRHVAEPASPEPFADELSPDADRGDYQQARNKFVPNPSYREPDPRSLPGPGILSEPSPAAPGIVGFVQIALLLGQKITVDLRSTDHDKEFVAAFEALLHTEVASRRQVFADLVAEVEKGEQAKGLLRIRDQLAKAKAEADELEAQASKLNDGAHADLLAGKDPGNKRAQRDTVLAKQRLKQDWVADLRQMLTQAEAAYKTNLANALEKVWGDWFATVAAARLAAFRSLVEAMRPHLIAVEVESTLLRSTAEAIKSEFVKLP
jgi:hypothetical protein